ncbi:MAG TPA: NAD(P)/FAD-dependent oxidoreductase [Dehalococcoidia bacterium]|jgi:thioredoxin reductase (NADPH)|nr:NAD(P)/FAD-dependent oxidoreductase [Dehalococcoidia bacterium]
MPEDVADVFDVTIIGAGPTGLFAAFYAGLRGMRTKIIEALPEVGGQLAVLYPEKFIYDVPGHPKILAKDLVKQLVEQIHLFQPTMVLGERIETLTRKQAGSAEVWRLGTDVAGHLSRTVVITAGIGAFEPNKLDRPGVEDYLDKGVYYFVKDKRPFRGKKILIIGGGDTAVDWALNLKDWAESITLIHRRDQFRCHEASLAELRTTDIPIMTFWELKRIDGDSEGPKTAIIYENRTAEERTLPVDVVLVSTGFKAALGPISKWGLEMVDNRHIKCDVFMATNLPGVFAGGDIAAVEGSVPLNLIVTGFGHAAIAANACKAHIDPAARMFPGHSSEMKL